MKRNTGRKRWIACVIALLFALLAVGCQNGEGDISDEQDKVLSAISIILYQGFFTLLGGYLEPLLGDAGITALSAEGGLLLILIALKLLGIKDAASGNFLPALVLAPIIQIAVDKL